MNKQTLLVVFLLGPWPVQAGFNLGMGHAVKSQAEKLDQKVEESHSPTVAAERFHSLPPTAKILFTSNRDSGTGSRRYEIYAMDANGNNVTRISDTKEHHFIMGLDPSKRYLVDSRAEEDTDLPAGLGDEDRRAVWVVDLETKQEKRLTDPLNRSESKSFSPDGEWLVFLMTLPGETAADLYKIKRDGTGLIRLTNTPNASEGDPCWSHDGTSIIFNTIDAATPREVIKKMDADGNNTTLVYDAGPGGVQVGTTFAPGLYDPAWSPDDQWIVFESPVQYTAGHPENFGSGIWHLFKVKIDGSGVVDLSLAGGHADRAEFFPTFSPSGQIISFGSIFYDASDPLQSHAAVFTMDANGGTLTQLITNPSSGKMPVWIP